MNQRNDPAERLHSDLWDGQDPPVYDSERALPIIDEALTSERRATVERIREVIGEVLGTGVPELRRALEWRLAILDEVANAQEEAAK